MKRTIVIVLFCCVAMLVPAQETQKAKVARQCIMIRPLVTIISGALGVTDIMIDIEGALSKDFTLNSIYEFSYYKGATAGMINLGISYNFMGNYLTGPYIGLYPGFGMINDSNPRFIFDLWCEGGYQHVLGNNLILNAYLGYVLMKDSSGPKFGVKIGYASP